MTLSRSTELAHLHRQMERLLTIVISFPLLVLLAVGAPVLVAVPPYLLMLRFCFPVACNWSSSVINLAKRSVAGSRRT